ncbi:Dynein light chain 1, axonemal [Phytophthora pseudosyringae]|uniref:Dynein light chain 1, axonemal n=1 Tax=Phytophthora pseudosyringae TaxID=221518 RepID=A0A8T1W163_9STRA|nr:Dynein light chain 1, axonemal [Phytophthora pseudosyringae]
MLECQTCGAAGDSFFSENYFGEMVCELCGTQSFLQARNETQDAEDMGLDITTVLKTLKRRVVRKRKRDANGNVVQRERPNRQKPDKQQQETAKLPELLDCVIATQMVLDAMARALVERVGADTFPADEYPRAVKELWFQFLKTWGVKGTMPLLRCYNEFFLYYTREEEESMDPAVTFDLLEQWDADWEKKKEEEEEGKEDEETKETKRATDPRDRKPEQDKPRKKTRVRGPRRRRFDQLNAFSIVDMVGILMLASRVLNLGLLPSDFADWVATGVIPYHNSLATCCADVPDVRDSVKFVARFFHSLMKRHLVTTVQVAYSAHHLQYHMGLRLPPLNVPLAAHRICATMGFPGEVYRNFQWITGVMNVKGDMTELPLLLQAEVDGYPRFKLKHTKKDRARVDAILESEIGIVAHLVVAIKMCANWHEWIFERRHDDEEDEESKDSGDGRRSKAPPAAGVREAHLLPRRDLDSFAQFARQVFVDPDKSGIPEGLQEHVEQLERIQATDELPRPGNDPHNKRLKQNDLYAYPAIHVNGVLAENDEEIEERMKRLRSQEASSESVDGEKKYDAFFYPVFYHSHRTALHAAYEHVLEVLCRKVNTSIASVLPILAKLDRRMQSLIYHFERTKVHVDLLHQGQAKWKAAKGAMEPTIINASSRCKRRGDD